MVRALVFGLIVSLAPVAAGQIVITEWMYNGAGAGSTGEYVEFTNIGSSPVNMTGWSFDDDSRIPGTISLSAFGVVVPGQSVILTDETAADFATIWGLSGVAIVGGNTANLGRNDEINLFDAAGNLMDRLTYGDEAFPGTVRTQNRSCNIPATDYGYTTPQTSWVLATAGDAYGSQTSTRGEIGSPGRIIGYAWSDFDEDGDVDLTDFAVWQECLTGASVSYDPLPPACTLVPDTGGLIAADADGDGDVDMADYVGLALCFSGEGNPADPACGSGSGGSDVTYINLHGTYITVEGSGVTVNGTKATITTEGTYIITGALADGQIVVSSAAAGVVGVVLNGIDISSSTTAPMYVAAAEYVSIVLADQTVNHLADPATYVYENPEDDEPNAALFSKDSLGISGTGSLTVEGNYNDAIASKDELTILGGTINVTAVDDGIRGKDYLLVQGGTITVTSGGDGLKSDNEEDPELGYISIAAGSFDIISGGDGIAAQTTVTVTGGDFDIVAGGGHTVTIPEELSAKGIKGVASVGIEDGTFVLDCADDGVHTNGNITISGGNLTIATNSNTTASYGDAIHADNAVQISNATVAITTCFEGIEGASISITNGNVNITSSDDAITADAAVNITGGNYTVLSGGGHTVTIPSSRSAKGIKGLTSVVIGGSGTFNLDCADDGIHSNSAVTINGGTFTIATNSSTSASYGDGLHSDNTLRITNGTITITTCYEGIEARDITIDGGTIRLTSTDDGINAAGGSGLNNYVRINGGYIAVFAAGDGIDSNGYITMTGGTVIVHGPTVNSNAAIDYDGTFVISGGFLVAAGSAGMAQAPSTTSTQRSVKITYSTSKTPGTLVHIQTTTGGTSILTFAPSKTYRSVVFSAPTLTAGTSFGLYRGGTCTGTVLDGLYTGGTYSGGTLTNTFTTTNIVTNVSAP
ncbi:MAG TPA: carbohydrate-binding domain-containing protein [Phycisphaerae bacterium]|nr:carbohydrate-binding domain-containing protein [Phycisphaerae bacterium]HNU45846.1 carbohydrate-binding domain-containing protein [Phycisphaerae bacterium]